MVATSGCVEQSQGVKDDDSNSVAVSTLTDSDDNMSNTKEQLSLVQEWDKIFPESEKRSNIIK